MSEVSKVCSECKTPGHNTYRGVKRGMNLCPACYARDLRKRSKGKLHKPKVYQFGGEA